MSSTSRDTLETTSIEADEPAAGTLLFGGTY
jgi:hypothetical protein